MNLEMALSLLLILWLFAYVTGAPPTIHLLLAAGVGMVLVRLLIRHDQE
jgi:hypothetical protein